MCIEFKNRPRKIIKHGNTRYELKIIRKSLGLNHRSIHKTLNDALAHRNELERQVNQVNQGHHQPLNKPQDSIENKLKKLIKYRILNNFILIYFHKIKENITTSQYHSKL